MEKNTSLAQRAIALRRLALAALLLAGSFEPAGAQILISTGSSSGARLYQTGSNDFWLDSTSGRLDLRPNGGSSIMTWTIDGNVGIGTTVPAAALDVNGATQFGSGAPKSTFTATANLQLVSGSTITSNGTLTISTAASVALTVTPALFINHQGQVGIGTMPNATLHVQGTPAATQPHLSLGLSTATSGQASSRLTLSGSGIEHAGFSWTPNTGAAGRLQVAFGGSSDPDLNTKRVTFQSDGRVGFGITNPGYQMTISTVAAGNLQSLWIANTNNAANANAAMGISVAGSSAGDPVLSFGLPTEVNWYMGADNSAGNRFTLGVTGGQPLPGGGDKLFIETGGGVGIGTSANGANLQVLGAMGATGWIGAGCETACSGDDYSLLYAGGTVDLYDTASTENRLNFSGSQLGVGVVPGGIYKLQVYTAVAGDWAGGFRHAGNSANADGIAIAAGPTTGSTNLSGYLVSFEDGDTTNMAYITYNTGAVSYGAFTGDHFGVFTGDPDTLESGDLLVMTGKFDPKDPNNPTGEPVYEVTLSTRPNDPRVFGVFGFKGGDIEPKGRLHIFALGNAYMKVTDANGNIKIGDYLTSSRRARFGQKQDGQGLLNYTIAKSQMAVNWEEVPVDRKLGFKWKKIPVSLNAQ